MKRKEFIEILKNSNISFVKIIRTLDWKGGYTNFAYFNEEARNYELKEFEYIEFEGNFDKMVENYTKIFYNEYTYDGMKMSEGFALWFIIKEEIMAMEYRK